MIPIPFNPIFDPIYGFEWASNGSSNGPFYPRQPNADHFDPGSLIQSNCN